jgi:hypothetical protein
MPCQTFFQDAREGIIDKILQSAHLLLAEKWTKQ